MSAQDASIYQHVLTLATLEAFREEAHVMARQLSATAAGHFSHPELQVGRRVRILSGDHRGVNGRVVAREWDDEQTDWLYFVRDGRVEYGPYLVRELW